MIEKALNRDDESSSKKDYGSKEEIVGFCIEAAKQRVKNLNRDDSFIKSDTLLVDLFPEDENSKIGEGMLVGEPGRLEYMVECELECLNDKFRLDCKSFFIQTMTIDQFADTLWEVKQKEAEGDESVMSKFKEFFKDKAKAIKDEIFQESDEETEEESDEPLESTS